MTGGSSPSLLTPGYSRRTALRFQGNSQADRVTPSHRFSSHGTVHQARLKMPEPHEATHTNTVLLGNNYFTHF